MYLGSGGAASLEVGKCFDDKNRQNLKIPGEHLLAASTVSISDVQP